MKYRIGDPRDPQPNDAQFETLEAAEIEAINQTYRLIDDDPVIAVWKDDEVISLVFAGVVYRS